MGALLDGLGWWMYEWWMRERRPVEVGSRGAVGTPDRVERGLLCRDVCERHHRQGGRPPRTDRRRQADGLLGDPDALARAMDRHEERHDQDRTGDEGQQRERAGWGAQV